MVEVIFVFDNEYEKERFLGQLSDGFGENYCDIEALTPQWTRVRARAWSDDELDPPPSAES